MTDYTGRLFEKDFCGNVADFRLDIEVKYQSWKKSANQIISKFTKDPDSNPCKWDVSDPDGLCSDLFYYVATALNVNTMSELSVYPAFGTPFDIFHGVDLFFRYNGKICTVDLSLRNEKVGESKANVVVTPETDLQWAGEVIARKMAA